MQRIVSGEGIHGLSKLRHSSDQDQKEATADLAPNEIDNMGVTISNSPSVEFDDTANFIENDGDEGDARVTTDMDVSGPQREPQQAPQRHNSGSLSPGGDASATATTQQTPLSIISGLFPTVTLLPISRNDSRNSGTTTSFGSGLQRSQNSSRDWGWFEDVHHSDQSVTGSTVGARMGGNNRNEGTNLGSSAVSSRANNTSLPQHQLATIRTGNIVHANAGYNLHGGASNEGQNSRITSNNDNGNRYAMIEGGGDSTSNATSNRNNMVRVRGRGDTNVNAASLLPTGDEMLIDDMQEYLEPILVNPRPSMENGKNVTPLFF